MATKTTTYDRVYTSKHHIVTPVYGVNNLYAGATIIYMLMIEYMYIFVSFECYTKGVVIVMDKIL